MLAGLQRFVLRLWPETMFGRQIVVLFCCLLLVQAMVVWILVSSMPSRPDRNLLAYEAAYVAAAAEQLTAMPPRERDRWLSRSPPRVADARWLPATTEHEDVHDVESESYVLGQMAIDRLGADYHLVQVVAGADGARPAIQLPDGSFVEFDASSMHRVGILLPLGNVFLLLLALVIGGYIVTRQVTGPLSRLVAAADTIGVDLRAPAVAEEGPIETRHLARAFNAMRDRLRLYLESRTEMLAAMSHDLGTPLTRMRLRVESVPDPEVRERFVADLAEMDSLVKSALSVLREQMDRSEMEHVDVEELLHELHDELAEIGGRMALKVDPLPELRGHRLLLKRAIGNVVQNAIKYAGAAEVVATVRGKTIRIAVRDRGPGVPEADLPRIFQPFYRVEASRNRDTGGSGLGLAIAFDAVHRHNGSIHARNRPEGGLEVNISLPSR